MVEILNIRPRKNQIMKTSKTITSFAIAMLLVLPMVGYGQKSRTSMNSKGGAAMDKAIRDVLAAQVEAWNRGDLEAFMKGYANSETTTFVSGDSLTRGWQTVLDRYRTRYDSREKMGVLAFSDLEINVLSSDAAIAIGKWQLTRTADTPHGRFTLVFKRTSAGWRIVYDHTS